MTEEQIRRLYPPRAIIAADPDKLSQFRGYIAQYKYSDVRILLCFLPGGRFRLMSRKREPIKQYRLSAVMKKALDSLGLDPEKTHVLDGGLMRSVPNHGERPIIVWDILVHDGRHLVGTTYASRYDLLKNLCGNPRRYETVTGEKIAFRVSGPLWLAPVFTGHFVERFKQAAPHDFLEGLMLKNPNGRLERAYREVNNTRWQIKFRKPATTYRF